MCTLILRISYLLIVVCCLSAAQLLQPPSIISSPPAGILYFTSNVGDKLTLPCVAVGNPKPNYEWRRNGVPFSVTPVRDGTYEKTRDLSYADEGYYQCFASNSEGMAMSNVTQVVMARQAAFADVATATRVEVNVGQTVTLPCSPTALSVPLPAPRDYSWRTEDGKNWQLNKRVQIDDNGNLQIAFVKDEDIDAAVEWLCYITNQNMKVEVGGSKTVLARSTRPVEAPRPPRIMFYTNKTLNSDPSKQAVVVGLEGRNVSLRCFFSGSENNAIEWRRVDGDQSLPTDGRVVKLNYNVELLIKNAKKSDEGVYACSATSGGNSAEFFFSLNIHALPTFQAPMDRPRDLNVSVGDNVKINCTTRAIPDATVDWFKNGVKLDPNNPSSDKRISISSDRRSLTILSVCKNNCTTGRSDLMVIQCNASNQYGYALANGYLNVFVRTNFTVKPKSIILSGDVLSMPSISFSALAVTDPNTPLTFTWYQEDKSQSCSDGWCQMYNVTEKILITNDNGTVLTIYKPNQEHARDYKCVVTNGISSDVFYVEIINPLATAEVWRWWWIPFLVLLLFCIVLLIIIICCCCLYRNRGDEYPVDEKEREADRNPEKELADSGFHDYQRPEGMQIATLQRPTGVMTPMSINSSIGRPGSEDGLSLNDYASMNAGKFTEDGSFIGQYNTGTRPTITPYSRKYPADSMA